MSFHAKQQSQRQHHAQALPLSLKSLFSRPCFSLVVPGDGWRPWSLPAGTSCDATWPASGEGLFPCPGMGSQRTANSGV